MGYLSKGIGGTASGAGTGAVIGTTVAGPAGAATGAVIGGATGLIGGLLGAADEEEARKQNLYDKALEAQYSGWFGNQVSTDPVRQIATTEGDLQKGMSGALQGFGTVEAMEQAKKNNLRQAEITTKLMDIWDRQNSNVAPLGSAYYNPPTASYSNILGPSFVKQDWRYLWQHK